MPKSGIGKAAILFVASATLAGSVWYLVEFFQWRAAFSRLLGTDFIKFIGLAWCAHFAYIVLRTWRWWVVVRHANRDVQFVDLYWITAVIVSLAILTPGQLGEALKIELLKRRGLLGRLPGLGAFALERVMDVIAIAGMGIVGLLFGSGLAQRYPGLKEAAATVVVVGFVVLYFLLRFDPSGKPSQFLARMRTGSGTPKIWAQMAILTIFSWVCVGVAWQIALYAVDVHVSLPEILWLISLVTLGMLLSFVPGGLGVAEVLTVEALANMGVTPVAAQAGALSLRAYSLIVIMFGLLHLLLWRLFRLSSRIRRDDSAN